MTDVDRAERDRLNAIVRDARMAARAAERQLKDFLDTLSPVKVGEVVEFEGKQFRVCRIDNLGNPEHPWLYGGLKKKDGTWGLAERCLYADWQKVDLT